MPRFGTNQRHIFIAVVLLCGSISASRANAETITLSCEATRGSPAPTIVVIDTSAQTVHLNDTFHADISQSQVSFTTYSPSGETSFYYSIDRATGQMQEYVSQHAKLLDQITFQCLKTANQGF